MALGAGAGLAAFFATTFFTALPAGAAFEFAAGLVVVFFATAFFTAGFFAGAFAVDFFTGAAFFTAFLAGAAFFTGFFAAAFTDFEPFFLVAIGIFVYSCENLEIIIYFHRNGITALQLVHQLQTGG